MQYSTEAKLSRLIPKGKLYPSASIPAKEQLNLIQDVISSSNPYARLSAASLTVSVNSISINGSHHETIGTTLFTSCFYSFKKLSEKMFGAKHKHFF